jgi:hypothetical protein
MLQSTAGRRGAASGTRGGHRRLCGCAMDQGRWPVGAAGGARPGCGCSSMCQGRVLGSGPCAGPSASATREAAFRPAPEALLAAGVVAGGPAGHWPSRTPGSGCRERRYRGLLHGCGGATSGLQVVNHVPHWRPTWASVVGSEMPASWPPGGAAGPGGGRARLRPEGAQAGPALFDLGEGRRGQPGVQGRGGGEPTPPGRRWRAPAAWCSPTTTP